MYWCWCTKLSPVSFHHELTINSLTKKWVQLCLWPNQDNFPDMKSIYNHCQITLATSELGARKFDSSPNFASDYVALSKWFTFLSLSFFAHEVGMITCGSVWHSELWESNENAGTHERRWQWRNVEALCT